MFKGCLTKMPGIPLVTRETIYSRTADLMCRQDSRVHLSSEEEIAAEESLSLYCKPVELYNILQRRAIDNPLFLQRCLLYKIQVKHKKRIHMKISLSGTGNYGLQAQSLFPLYILLARQISDTAEYSAVYRFTRACILNASSTLEGRNRSAADFLLPEVNKLAAEVKSGSLSILFVSCENFGGHCLLGKLQLDTLYLSWEKSASFSLGQRAEMLSTVDLHPCFMKPNCLGEDKCVSFHSAYNLGTTNKQVQVIVSAEELGAKEKSPYNSHTYNGIPTSLPHIIRLRLGNVIFNYRYYNNKLQRTEVTEDFSCPFCLVKCASFKGLRYHLSSSHDLFNFEFWVTEEYQAINVSVKTDSWRTESVVDDVDPKQETFSFCSKPLRRRKPKSVIQHAKHVHSLDFESNLSATADAHSSKADRTRLSSGNEFQNANLGTPDCVEHVASSANVTRVSIGTAHPYVDPECVQSFSEGNIAPPAMLQFAKTRKLSVERSDPRNRALLQRRQFFHSHRAQPMALEQALSDRDSEDEVDDDVADFEDRRLLDDFVDVTKDEKQMMHLWNSFVRKQRVLADGHIPWACEAFSRLHGHDLAQAPALIWCWRLCMIKLWNHGLLDARTMNNCNIILERFQNQDLDLMKS